MDNMGEGLAHDMRDWDMDLATRDNVRRLLFNHDSATLQEYMIGVF